MRRLGEKGVASLEVLGIVPFVLFVAFLAWQLAVGGYAAVYANEAARNAARAATLGQDAEAAARATLPTGLTAVDVTDHSSGDSRTFTVTVEVPRFTKLVLGPVSRTVTMPDIQ